MSDDVMAAPPTDRPPPLVEGILFVELTSLDDLRFPTSASKRVKFTCVSASARHLVLGTSSGTGYAFSRYRQRNKQLSTASANMPPVDVFVTKDGPVNTLLVSPSELLVAVGSDSGRVSVAALATDGQPTSIAYTVAGDARKPDKVTSLLWSLDSKSLYAGHASGAVHVHRLAMRSVFRSTHDVLLSLDASIVQMDLLATRLLISTTAATHIYEMENGACLLMGTQPRNGRMGACFIRSGDCEYIVAARPSGRVWEANLAGAIYKTHPFRQTPAVPRFHAVSYRSPYLGSQEIDKSQNLETTVNTDVNAQLLYGIKAGKSTLVLSWYDSLLVLLDTESTNVRLLTDLEEEIVDVSVCGSDVFVLFGGNSFLKKYTVFTRSKTIEKLFQRGCYTQAAQLIISTDDEERWPETVIRNCIEHMNTTSRSKRDREAERARAALVELLAQRSRVQTSVYDNCDGGNDPGPSQPVLSSRLPSGVHRVVVQAEASGCEDEFVFRLPTALREKCRSSPAVDGKSLAPAVLNKQNSMPLTSEELEDRSRHGTPDVTRQDILTRARNLLETDGHVFEVDSLRTLLQLESPTTPTNEVMFLPTITVANAARSLAELAKMTSPIDVNEALMVVERRRAREAAKRAGPTIVKPVARPRQQVVVRPRTSPRSPVGKVEVILSPLSRTKTPTSPLQTIETNSNNIIVEADRLASPGHASWNDEENNVEVDALNSEWLDQRLGRLELADGVPSPPSGTLPTTQTTPLAATVPQKRSVTPQIRDHCDDCGMHKTWVGLSLLSSMCRKVAVLQELFSVGGVPRSAPEWTTLLERRMRSPSSATICPRCEMGMASASRTLGSLPTSAGLAADGTRLTAEKIRERVAGTDPDRLRMVLFGKKTTVTVNGTSVHISNGNRIASTSSSAACSPTAEAQATPVAVEREVLEVSETFGWLGAVEIPTLLFLCCLVLGHKELLAVLRESPTVVSLLDDDDWTALVKMSVREQAMKKNLLSTKTISDVLTSVGLSSFLSADVTVTATPSPRGSLHRRTSAPAMYSWIVDCSGSCPICTLPLQTVVAGQDLGVSSYNCGHAYHTPCLAGRGFCVACRVRARKMAALKNSRGKM